MSKTPGDLLQAFLDALAADGASDMEMADTLRGAAALLGYGAAEKVDLNCGTKS